MIDAGWTSEFDITKIVLDHTLVDPPLRGKTGWNEDKFRIAVGINENSTRVAPTFYKFTT